MGGMQKKEERKKTNWNDEEFVSSRVRGSVVPTPWMGGTLLEHLEPSCSTQL